MSAPTTLLVLGLLMGLYLTWAAFIPGALSPTEVATALGFGAAEITIGLGASDPIAAWPFWLLCLFTAIHLVARLLSPRDPHPRLATTVTVRATATPDALVPRLAKLAPRQAFFRSDDGQTLVLRRGAAAEGAIAIALGLVALVLSFVLNKDRALDAQLSVTTDDVSGATTRSTVNIEGNTIERALPFRLVCSPPDPLDSNYTFSCLFAGPEALDTPGAEVTLRPGVTSEIDGYRLTPLRATPIPRASESKLSLLWRPGDEASPAVRVSLEAGQTIAIDDAAKTSFRGGVLGGLPWLVMGAPTANSKTTPTLLLPSGVGDSPAMVALLNAERLDVRVQDAPPRWLFWLGLALILVGLVVWIAVPDLTFTASILTASNGTSTTRVTISSINRPSRLAAWIAAVADGPPGRAP